MHREINFTAGSPALQTPSTKDRVVANDLQISPHNRGIRVRVNQVENEMAAVALRKRITMNAGMLGRTEFRAYVVVTQVHGVVARHCDLIFVTKARSISFSRILPRTGEQLRRSRTRHEQKIQHV